MAIKIDIYKKVNDLMFIEKYNFYFKFSFFIDVFVFYKKNIFFISNLVYWIETKDIWNKYSFFSYELK
jgi:hypothetical protein